ncbi:SEC-C metal-binding domain-containing protein [Pedobacter aquatilis]|uniref:YecA family protein n=1 Tax=Pedobacter aquatilis TaxID=351343 RepID=UPI0025B36CA7|nr:SEC-C metal-binding domain-containing protein [Pedobacter aquatilis]MDN3585664.1 SEC-C metal-binding domain-containing protein [Pedobacter aquatilis]
MEHIKDTAQVISDLRQLINQKGYIYTLCLILFEDFHHDLNKIHQVDPRDKLSVKESALLIGLLSQQPFALDYPDSPEATLEMKTQTYELMKELQFSFNAKQFAKLKEMMEKQQNGETLGSEAEDKLEFFVKDAGMVEPMFYAGDGVYDFQYLEFLERKYKYDQPWLEKEKGFVLNQAISITKAIKAHFHKNTKRVNLMDLKTVFPKFEQKVKKKLKKYSPSVKQIMLDQQFVAASFYQYRDLFPDPQNQEPGAITGWHTFYDNLLDMFMITESDLSGQQGGPSFFENFSFAPGGNTAYNGPGYFNLLHSRPIIRFDAERYFVPIGYLIPEAVYESPFYWMTEDKAYANALAKHRGDVGEEIAFEFLQKVFGKENTFRSVIIKAKNGTLITDIDVLCLLGNKAICVQVKSKKLTLMAKRGDFEQLSKDFQGAVQDAYEQGLVSRSSLLQDGLTFLDESGKEIPGLGTGRITEAYIMGVTTENYPALVHQVGMLLQKQEGDPAPLVLSVFDLELLSHYLPDPYDFLYYVRQRIRLTDYFKADEELVYLGYHLHQKLWPIEGYDGGMLEGSYGANIDRNYYPYKTGQLHLLPEKDDPIANRWKDPRFDELIKNIKASNHPQLTDIVFHLLDWSGKARENIVTTMGRLKNDSRRDRLLKSIATANAPDFGISYVVLNGLDFDELNHRVCKYAALRKYASKCDAWLGIGAFAGSNKLIDFLIYLDEPWKHDPILEQETQELLSRSRAAGNRPVDMRERSKKIGRNEPCFCQSGKKYKRCCGQ